MAGGTSSPRTHSQRQRPAGQPASSQLAVARGVVLDYYSLEADSATHDDMNGSRSRSVRLEGDEQQQHTSGRQRCRCRCMFCACVAPKRAGKELIDTAVCIRRQLSGCASTTIFGPFGFLPTSSPARARRPSSSTLRTRLRHHRAPPHI